MDHRHTSTLATTPAGAHASRLALVLDFTALYLIAEVVGGLLTRSLAWLADVGYMLTDVEGLALTLLAMHGWGIPGECAGDHQWGAGHRLATVAATAPPASHVPRRPTDTKSQHVTLCQGQPVPLVCGGPVLSLET